MASILYDDTTSSLELGGGDWNNAAATRYFGGSTVYPAFSTNNNGGDTGVYASLKMLFHGTSISFYGNTPPQKASQYALISIDGGQSSQSFYNDPSPQTTKEWYESPSLSDGSHTISISRIAGTAVDYMVVTAGLTTPLSGQTLIVDDSDSSVVYSGAWATPSGPFQVTGDSPIEFYAHGNTLHRMSSVGSSLSLKFTGTSISVFSVFDYSKVGHMVVTYTVDSQTKTQPYTVSSSTPGYRPHVLLFSQDGLSGGSHTLKIEMISNNGMALGIDYILYKPSFASLAEKLGINTATLKASPTTPTPAYTTNISASPTNADSVATIPRADASQSPSTHSIGDSSGSQSSSLVSGSGLSRTSSSSSHAIPTSNISGSSSTNSNNTSSATNSTSTSSPPIGAIVGAVLGVVALILALILFFLRKRRRRRALLSTTAALDSDIFQDKPNNPLIRPFPFLAATPTSTIPNTNLKGSRKISVPSSTTHYPYTSEPSAAQSEVYSPFLSSTTDSKSNLGFQASQDAFHLVPLRTASPSSPAPDVDTPDPDSQIQTRIRMRNLQGLVKQLNEALVSTSRPNTVHIAELRGRINALVSAEGSDSGSGYVNEVEVDSGWRSTSAGVRVPSGVPPPYER